MERKDFIKAACGICTLYALPGFLTGCSKTDTPVPAGNFTVDLSQSANAELNTVGGYKIINGVLIIHSASAGFVALQAACTHQGCTTGYNSSNNDIECPCHGGVYDLTGKVVSGPPPDPLHKYTVTQSGTILTIV